MAEIAFQTLGFREREGALQVDLLRHFSTIIPKEDLASLGEWKIIDGHTLALSGKDIEKIRTKFLFLFDKHLPQLKTKLTGNPAVYIHQNSNIPLLGNPAFGIVCRGSSIIEIKPITSCNLDCVYCSVGEGLSSKKTDFVIEKDYLVEELKAIIDFVGESVEIHVGVQGEPFFYVPMEELLADLEEMPLVHTVSIDTNGTLLTKEKVDRLSAFQKLQLNLSLDAIDETIAKKMAGTSSYNLKHVMKIIAYCSEKMPRQPIVAPVVVPGQNDQEMGKIIEFVKTLPRMPILGIQNFLPYKTGRNPTASWSWEQFYHFIKDLEKRYDIKLRLSEEDFKIRKIKDLPKPFQNDDVVQAIIKCPDRFKDTSIAVAKGRMISIPNCPFKKDKHVTVKINRDKHNIFSGKLV
ncbi:MAG TPA: radical SAM protein [Candidatus Nanoarchaeia archaeon]|nr:radical SAM protein [Candidatus Nanoarchaeia archaeon]